MTCRLCKRGSCTESFHSLDEQCGCSCPRGSERDANCKVHGEDDASKVCESCSGEGGKWLDIDGAEERWADCPKGCAPKCSRANEDCDGPATMRHDCVARCPYHQYQWRVRGE